jgi:hypothetical protein
MRDNIAKTIAMIIGSKPGPIVLPNDPSNILVLSKINNEETATIAKLKHLSNVLFKNSPPIRMSEKEDYLFSLIYKMYKI